MPDGTVAGRGRCGPPGTLAAVAERVELGPLVASLGSRTGHAGQDGPTVGALSGGRLVLGVGADGMSVVPGVRLPVRPAGQPLRGGVRAGPPPAGTQTVDRRPVPRWSARSTTAGPACWAAADGGLGGAEDAGHHAAPRAPLERVVQRVRQHTRGFRRGGGQNWPPAAWRWAGIPPRSGTAAVCSGAVGYRQGHGDPTSVAPWRVAGQIAGALRRFASGCAMCNWWWTPSPATASSGRRSASTPERVQAAGTASVTSGAGIERRVLRT